MVKGWQNESCLLMIAFHSGTMMQGAPSDDGAGSLIGRILKKAAQ
jgi:hypothetical protein